MRRWIRSPSASPSFAFAFSNSKTRSTTGLSPTSFAPASGSVSARRFSTISSDRSVRSVRESRCAGRFRRERAGRGAAGRAACRDRRGARRPEWRASSGAPRTEGLTSAACGPSTTTSTGWRTSGCSLTSSRISRSWASSGSTTIRSSVRRTRTSGCGSAPKGLPAAPKCHCADGNGDGEEDCTDDSAPGGSDGGVASDDGAPAADGGPSAGAKASGCAVGGNGSGAAGGVLMMLVAMLAARRPRRAATAGPERVQRQ